MRLVLELFWLPLCNLLLYADFVSVTTDLDVLSFAFLSWRRLEGLSLATSVLLVIPGSF